MALTDSTRVFPPAFTRTQWVFCLSLLCLSYYNTANICHRVKLCHSPASSPISFQGPQALVTKISPKTCVLLFILFYFISFVSGDVSSERRALRWGSQARLLVGQHHVNRTRVLAIAELPCEVCECRCSRMCWLWGHTWRLIPVLPQPSSKRWADNHHILLLFLGIWREERTMIFLSYETLWNPNAMMVIKLFWKQ